MIVSCWSLEAIPFQPSIWRYPEKVLDKEVRTPRDKRQPSLLHKEWRTDSREAGSGPGTAVSLSWDLAKQKMLFQGGAGRRGAMGWWVGDGPRDPLDRVDSQSARLAALAVWFGSCCTGTRPWGPL